MKFIVCALLLFCSAGMMGQNKKSNTTPNKKNYVLEINGDTVSISLDEPARLKTKSGQTLDITLKQKEVLTYTDSLLSFQYSSTFTVTVKQFEDMEQILCISAGGNSFLIQKYKDTDPGEMDEYMLEEITKESVDAGYKQTKADVSKRLRSGRVVKGKQATLVLEDETNIYSVFPVKLKKDGLMIVMIAVDPADEKEMKAFDIFWKSLEIKN